MCLIYRGYDDFDSPLNCAYAETDCLTTDEKQVQIPTKPANVQYIGYIEGPPPFYMNDTTHLGKITYIGDASHPISKMIYSNTVSTSVDQSIGFEVGISASVNCDGYKAALAYNYKNKCIIAKSTTATAQVKMRSSKESYGTYITQTPKVYAATYQVHDVHGTIIYPTYYFWLMQPDIELLNVPLQSALNTSDPKTYMNRGIQWANYPPLSASNSSWSSAGSSLNGKVSIETGKTQTSSNKVTLGLSHECEGVGPCFGMDIEGSCEWETTITTTTGDEIECETELNDAFAPTDVEEIDYTTYWLPYSPKQNNWWLYPGQTSTSLTWCVTYEVNKLILKNRTIIPAVQGKNFIYNPVEAVVGKTSTSPGSSIVGIVTPPEFSLSQNYPNPFRPTTIIKYQIGFDKMQTNPNDQESMTQLIVYNLSGQKVAILVNEMKTPGSYEVSWDASQFAPGVYFYSLQYGNFKDVKKLVLLK